LAWEKNDYNKIKKERKKEEKPIDGGYPFALDCLTFSIIDWTNESGALKLPKIVGSPIEKPRHWIIKRGKEIRKEKKKRGKNQLIKKLVLSLG